MSRVLIGIPTFRRPQFVTQAVQSVRDQSFQDWRAIVSDNASPGDAGARIRDAVGALGDSRVSFHQQPENRGEYGQGRYFLAQAEALGCDYFVMLHDDDKLEPGHLEAAVAALDAHPGMALFACNANVMIEDGTRSAGLTEDFDRRSQRVDVAVGPIDVLSTHMACGFTPISGAFFRVAALKDSGFVDADLYGCVPFEINIFLRLGERGAKAWFDSRRLLSFRSHSQQMQKTDYLNNEEYVRLTIRLFERRRFEGVNEQRRRQYLGRLHRIEAMHKAHGGDYAGARQESVMAMRANAKSVRTWLVAAGTHLAPYVVRTVARAWLSGAGAAIPRPAQQ